MCFSHSTTFPFLKWLLPLKVVFFLFGIISEVPENVLFCSFKCYSSGATKGISTLNKSSITFIYSSFMLSMFSKYLLLIWLWYLWIVFFRTLIIYINLPIHLSMTPALQFSFPFWYSFKKMFSPGIYNFVSVFLFTVFLISFGNSFFSTDLIFLMNINSTGDNPELVLGFSATWYKPLKIAGYH